MSSIVYEGKIIGISKPERVPELSLQVGKQLSIERAPFYIAIVAQQRSQSFWYDLDGRLLAIKDTNEQVSELSLRSLPRAEGDTLYPADGLRYTTIADYLSERSVLLTQVRAFVNAGFDMADDVLAALDDKRMEPIDASSRNHKINGSDEPTGRLFKTDLPAQFNPLEALATDDEAKGLLTQLKEHLRTVTFQSFHTTVDGTYIFDLLYSG